MQQQGKNNIEQLANKVKALRLKQSSSLNKFVFNKGGVTSATWSRIENGKVDVKLTTLIKVAAMLNVTLDELVKDIDFDYKLDE